jgi:hypothetical protein
MFKVYARRWRKFPTLEAAKAYCDQVFKKTGIVLGIEQED